MIAAVNGIACGGGFEVVLGTDIIVMEEHARFALPEIQVGVLADAGTVKLRRRIPYHVAVEFLMTGRWMDAAEAEHWGLANHVVPKGEGMKKARKSRHNSQRGRRSCFRQSSNCCVTPRSFRSTKPSNYTMRWMRCNGSSDPRSQRGHAGFSEKRNPRWSGR